MVKLDDSKDFDDRELKDLFDSLDSITASDELKSSTLAFIFDQEEEEVPEEGGAKSKQHSHLKIVEDDVAIADAEGPMSGESPEIAGALDPESSAGDEEAAPKKARRRHNRGWRLRVTAAIVAFALIAGGGVAYATPANHVLVTVDDTTFDLGVNIFGSTVSAKANTNDGKAVIDAANVHNKEFGDACDQLLNAFEKRRGAKPDEVSLEVENRFGGGGDKIKEDAGNVIERHRESRNLNSSEPSVPSIPQTEESTGGPAAPSQDSRPASDDNVSAESAPRNAEGDVGGNDAGSNNVGPNNADAMQPDANDTSALTAPSNDGPTGGQGGNMGEREPESGDRTQEPLAQGSPMQGRSGEDDMAPGQR